MSFGHATWPAVRFGVIGEAWQLYKRHWGVWSLAMLVVLAGNVILTGAVYSVLGIHDRGHHGGFRWPITPTHGVVQYLVTFVITGFFLAGMIRMAGNQIRGRAPRVEDLFAINDVWLDVVLGSVLYGAVILVGLWCFVIPGLIAAGVFMFALPLVVEAKLPATGAMIQSWHTLKSQWLTATVFQFVLFLLAGSGAILCGIGLLLTGPLYCLSIAILYHDLLPYDSKPVWKSSRDPFPDI